MLVVRRTPPFNCASGRLKSAPQRTLLLHLKHTNCDGCPNARARQLRWLVLQPVSGARPHSTIQTLLLAKLTRTVSPYPTSPLFQVVGAAVIFAVLAIRVPNAVASRLSGGSSFGIANALLAAPRGRAYGADSCLGNEHSP